MINFGKRVGLDTKENKDFGCKASGVLPRHYYP